MRDPSQWTVATSHASIRANQSGGTRAIAGMPKPPLGERGTSSKWWADWSIRGATQWTKATAGHNIAVVGHAR